MSLSAYCGKFKGAGAAGVPIPPWSQSAWSFLAAFTGISVLGLLQTYLLAPDHLVLFVPAFGAMAVLLFSAVKVPASQPYNAIVGNSIGGLIGVLVVMFMQLVGCENMFWLCGALSVSLTIVCQEQTRSQHPPGGATALIFAIIIPIQKQHFMYVITPALLGAAVMVAVALVMNNLSSARQYPQFWSLEKPKEELQQLLQVEMKEVGKLAAAALSSTEEEPSEPSAVVLYFKKMLGVGGEAPPRPELSETFFSFLGAFLGMSALGLLHSYFLMPDFHLPVEVAAFGAMSVLIFSLGKGPLSQPTNVVLGNSIGGAVGWAVVELMGAMGLSHLVWLSGALSVALTIVTQERCNAVHPPGGATALLFAVTPALQQLGAKFIFAPAFLGAVILVIMGALANNLSPKRAYPQRWLFDDEASS